MIWDCTQVSWATGKHSTHYTNETVKYKFIPLHKLFDIIEYNSIGSNISNLINIMIIISFHEVLSYN